MVLDYLGEQRPPFSPEEVTARAASDFKRYEISRITGDKYTGEWPREAFRKFEITYEVAEKTKSELYGELLPLLNSSTVELLDSARLLMQLRNLERRTSRSGRDSIDHQPGAHDDVANAVAGAVVCCGGIQASAQHFIRMRQGLRGRRGTGQVEAVRDSYRDGAA